MSVNWKKCLAWAVSRFPFLNALTLLMFLGEKAKDDDINPPLKPRVIYVNLGIFVACACAMSWRMKHKEAALIHAGQLLYLAYTFFTADKLHYNDWLRIKICHRMVGVSGIFLLFSHLLHKSKNISLQRYAEILIGMSLVCYSYLLMKSKDDMLAITDHLPGGETMSFAIAGILGACACSFLGSKFTIDGARFSIATITFLTLLIEFDMAYWMRKRIDFWLQIRLICDNVFFITGLLLYVLCYKVKDQSHDHSD